MKNLFSSIYTDLRDCAQDDYGPHAPRWEHSERYPTGIVITTRWSRDPSRSNNGGEYFMYSRYRPLEDGRVIHETGSSYEDADWEMEEIFGLSSDSLERIAELARLRILAEDAPPPIADQKVLRRRIEDALRKTSSINDLVAVATMLGVKLS